ncbi:MAG: DUF4375 domain-containing protein [Lentisphaeraceae bacterium]|nr:DUF4375 domain-containing protein [Lentisphaeraceae bacterium]
MFLGISLFWWIVITIITTLFSFFIKNDEGGNFKDYLKDPSLWDNANNAFKARDDMVAESKNWSSAEIEQIVNYVIFGVKNKKEAWCEFYALGELGTACHPAVMKVLNNRELDEKLLKINKNKNELSEAAFNRVCKRLGDTPPLDAANIMKIFLNHESELIHKDAAFVLGKIGSPEAISYLLKAFTGVLNGDDWEQSEIISYSLMGLEYAIENDSFTPEAGKPIFEILLHFISSNVESEEAAGIALFINRDRATEFFLSENNFNLENGGLRDLLKVMVKAKNLVPQERLYSLIQELEKVGFEYPNGYVMAETLKMLSLHQAPSDITLFKKFLHHESAEVVSGASLALLTFHGKENFEENISNIEEEFGEEKLSEEQKWHSAVALLDYEVCNGGFSQYFVNSSANRWHQALEGLQEMGFIVRTEILKKALAAFGGDGPSDQRNKRQEQLSELICDEEDAFDEFDDLYYDCAENMQVFSTRYVLGNLDFF